VEHGMVRDEAYKRAQTHAMAAWESETSFRDRVAADPNVKKYLDEAALKNTFSLDRQLRNVGAIFERLFAGESAEKES